MKLTFTRYEAYKNSDVDWLGSVPAKWAVVRNKEVFKERSSLSTTGKETLLTVSHITGVTPRSEKNVNMFMAETMEGYKICRPGDLIINTMWAWMGALGTSNELGICSPSYNVYMPIKGVPYNHGYFDYLFRIPNAIVEMTRNSKGIVSSRLRLYAKDFFQIETVLPSLKEQEAIAHYLDTKTAQIDRQIDLLTQKATLYSNLKQSLINETVTRGLDKSVPMKDSGIDAIGDVPEHWKIKKLKSFVDIRGRIGFRGYTTADIVLQGEGAISLSPSNIVDNKITLEKCTYLSWEKYNESPEIKIEDGDIVFVKTGSTIGKVALIDKLSNPMTINPQLVVFKTVKIHSKYLFYVMQSISFLDEIFISTIGGATQALSQADLGATHIIFPPRSEQQAIANYLDTKTAQIDQIIQTINTQIEKLKELRKTMINDVVTGKIKVV